MLHVFQVQQVQTIAQKLILQWTLYNLTSHNSNIFSFNWFLWHHENYLSKSHKWLPIIRVSIFWTLPYFKHFPVPGVFCLLHLNSKMWWLKIRWKKIWMQDGMSHQTLNAKSNSLSASIWFIFFRQKSQPGIRHDDHFCQISITRIIFLSPRGFEL